MEDSRRDSPQPPRVTRRMFIIIWLWGVVSLFAIGGVFYHLFRERIAIPRRHLGSPEDSYGFADGDDGSAVRPSAPADGCGSTSGSSSSSSSSL